MINIVNYSDNNKQGAVQGLVVYFANHLAHPQPTINLKYNTDGHPEYGSPDTNKDLNSALRTAKRIFAKNGYRLKTEQVQGVEGHTLEKNEAFLNFVSGSNLQIEGNSPYNSQYYSFVASFANGLYLSTYEFGYTIAHETWHQLYNRSQMVYNGSLIHESTGYHDNSVPNLNKGGSYESENILPYQSKIVNYFLNDKNKLWYQNR